MRTRRNFLIFAAAVVVVLVAALFLNRQVARNVVIDGRNIGIGGQYLLDTTHPDDLVLFGDVMHFSADSVVEGDASIIGNVVNIDGRIKGDLTVIGSRVVIAPDAAIEGDANLLIREATIGGQVAGDLQVTGDALTLLADAQISGAINGCATLIDDQRGDAAAVGCTGADFAPFDALIALRDSSVRAGTLSMQSNPAAALVLTIFGTAILAGTSALLVTLFPHQISHIEEALRARPRSFGGVGIAVYAVAMGMFFALVVALAVFPPLGLLLVPVFLVLGVLLLVLVTAGMVTLALMLGDWLLRRTAKPGTPPLVAALVGSLLLSALFSAVALLPFGGALSLLALGGSSAAGLGAAVFTRAGTRPMRRSTFIQG